MSSPRKIASARSNGAKSRGPVTAHGKQSSALNALDHGLTARTVVLFNESADEYQSQLRAYLDHFHPQNNPEADLVHQLAAAYWRIARYAGVESGLLEQRMQDQEERLGDDLDGMPEHHRLAMAFHALSGANSALALLNRYQSRLHHEYQRILKMLLQMQSKRTGNAKLPNEPNPISEHPAGAQALSLPPASTSYQIPSVRLSNSGPESFNLRRRSLGRPVRGRSCGRAAPPASGSRVLRLCGAAHAKGRRSPCGGCA